jgi:hypothetical protein
MSTVSSLLCTAKLGVVRMELGDCAMCYCPAALQRWLAAP